MSRATRILWRLFFAALILFILLIVAVNYGLLGYMPSIRELENPKSDIASEVYASDGTILGKYYIQNRTPSEFNEISPNVINALIATEDARFMEHSGIDGIAVLRAVLLLGTQGGGSTLTQQLAKNLFPRHHANMFTLPIIKLKEWMMAVKLERNFTKEEIITLYLNTVPFGDNTYGIRNASLTFYSKTPDKLSVDEAAVLVGMLKGNTLYNPHRNPKRALERRNTVIGQMEKYDYLTEEQAEKLKQKPIVLHYSKQNNHEGLAPYFRMVVKEEIKQWCKQHEKANGKHYNIYKDGLKIYTTLDPRMQRYAEEAVAEHLKSLQKEFSAQSKIKNGTVWKEDAPQRALTRIIQRSQRYLSLKDEGLSEKEIMNNFKTAIQMKVFTWKTKSHEKDTLMSPLDSIKYMRSFLQAGFMAMDPHTGQVKAWVGGIQHEFFQYDHVNISTKRQVGSAIKPLLYCLAVDNGYSPCSSVSTLPQQFPHQDKPYDAGGTKSGSTSMKNALAHSINNAALFLLNQVGIDAFVSFVHKTGISSNIEKVPSIALGVSDISLYEMLWAYTMFPNKGINTKPIYILKIEDKNGNVLQNYTPIQKEIINENTAYKMVLMMEGVTEFGTGVRLRYRYGLTGDMAGKTGTTNNQSDAWFIGYTPQLLAGAWVGCDDRFLHFSSLAQGQGAAAALPIWAYFMKKVRNDPKSGIDKDAKFVAPQGFVNCEDLSSFPYYNGNGTDSTNVGDSLSRQNGPMEEIPPSEWK
jgi:penicillin-binding protein 1A